MRHSKRANAFFGLLTAVASIVLGTAGASTALAETGTDPVVTPNDVNRGSVVVYKYDAETELSAPQGGATLAGAEFTITNKSDAPVVYHDEFGHTKVYNVNESWTITTKWDKELKAYVAKTPAEALPQGTYHIQETKSSPGYALATDETYLSRPYIPGYLSAQDRKWVTEGYDFTISAQGQDVTFVDRDTAEKAKSEDGVDYVAGPGAYNPLVRGGIAISKRDHDLRSGIPQGDSKLRDGIWVIYNWNPYPVRVWDHFDQDANGIKHGVVASEQTVETSRFSSAPEDYASGADGAAAWQQSWSTQIQESVTGVEVGEPSSYDGTDGTPYYQDSAYTTTVNYTGGGWVAKGGVVAVVRSGDDGRAHTFMDALPVGYYKVVEVEAPLGYSNSELWQSFPSVQEHNWDELVETDADDPVARGAASFRKVDGDVRISGAQGNMTMSGTHIEIYNDSERDVVIRDGEKFSTGDVSGISGRIASGQKVAEVVTGDDGWATIKGLPYGTYYAVEKTPPVGYGMNSNWKFHFSIRDTELGKMTSDGNNVVVKTEDKIESTGLTGDTTSAALSNMSLLKNRLEISKHDQETNGTVSMVTGEALVAKFRVQLALGGNSILWSADKEAEQDELIEYKPGDYLLNKNGEPWFETSSRSGKVVLENLPNCDLIITEYEAPIGYQLNTQEQHVSLSDTAPAEAAITFSNQVMREDLQFQKVDSDTMKPMGNVAFLLEKYGVDENGDIRYDENGKPIVVESHILVTDDDGMVDTTSKTNGYQGWRLRNADNINLADGAYDGASVDESKLTYETAYWFDGGTEATVSADLGALPFGWYHLTELRCEANKGKNLVDRDISITRGAGLVENIGTIDNSTYQPSVCCDTSVRGTEAQVELEANPAHGVTVNGDDVITYTVHYENTTADPIPYLQIRDRIPGSTTYVEDSASNDGVYVDMDGKSYVEWVIKDIKPGESGEVTFQVKVDRNATTPIISHQARYGVWTSEVVAGDVNNVNPYGSSNVVQHSTDGTTIDSRLFAEKTSSVAPDAKVKVGDTITYTVKVTNMGPERVTNVGISDNVPMNTHVQILNSPETDYQDKANISEGGRFLTDNTIVWDIEKLESGESREVSFTVVVDETAGERIRNQATYGFTMGHCNGEMDNVTNIITNAVKTDPELTVTKSSSAHDGVAPGEIVTYTLHMQNDGRGNARNVNLYDVIPAGTQYVMGSASSTYTADESHVYPFSEVSSQDAGDETPYVAWTIPVIYNRGGSIDVTYQVRVKDSAAIGDVVRNRATVGGEDGPLAVNVAEPESTDDPVNVPAVSNLVEDVVIDPLKDVTVTKTADPESGSNVAPGDIITYTIEWKNDENGHPVQGFGVRDSIPENTTFIDGSIVLVGADGVSSTEIKAEQQAAIDAGDDCGEVVAPVSESIVWTPRAAINRSDPEGIYRALMGGNPDTHHIRMGWRTLKSTLERLQPGEYVEFEVAVDDDYDQLWRATYREDGVIVLLMKLLVPSADDSINYATAHGGRANYDQKWNDVWAIIDELAPGETGKLTFQVRVNDDVEPNTDIMNVATYGAGVFSAPCFDLPNETNETVHTVGEPHLTGVKTAEPAEYVKVGDKIHYTVEITNDGTARARDVVAFDRFRTAGALDGCVYVPGSWKVSGGDSVTTSAKFAPTFVTSSEYVYAKTNVLEPNDTLKMEFDVILVSAKEGDKIENVASFDSGVTEIPTEDLFNKTNGTSIEVDAPSLSVSKTVDAGAGSQVKVGDTLEYNITLTNDSHVKGTGYGLYDEIPQNTVYVAGSASAGLVPVTVTEPDMDAEPIEGENGEMVQPTVERVVAIAAKGITLDAGESKSFTFKVTVDPMLMEDTVINNSATAGFVDKLPEQALELRSEAVINEAIAPKVAIRVAETSDPAAGTNIKPGDVVTYTIQVLNESDKPASNVCVFNYVPENMTYVDGSATGGLSLTNDTQTGKPALIAKGLSIGAHESVTLTFAAKANDTWSDLVATSHATAGVFEGTPKAELEVDSGEVLHNIVATKPVLSVVASADPAAGTDVKPGDEITYTVELSETAGAPVSNGAVFAYLPEGTELADGGLAGGLEAVTDAEGNTVAVRASGITLDPFGTQTLSFKVRVLDAEDDFEISETVTAGMSDKVPVTTLPVAANVIQHMVVAPKPELTLTKSATPDSGEAVKPGDTITYTLTLKNSGEGKATGVAVFDEVPNNTQLVSESMSGLTAGEGYVFADGITIGAGESKSLAFTVRVRSDLVDDGLSIHNEATWAYAEAPKARLANVSNAIDHNIVVPKPSISVIDGSTPDAGTNVVAGDTITYTFTIAETAGVRARNIGVFAYVPANTEVVDAQGLTLIDTDAGQALVVDGMSLPGGGSKTFSVSVVADTVNEDTGIVFRPTAGIGEAAVAPLSVDGEEIHHTIVAPKADLRIAMSSAPENGSEVETCDTIDYTVTLTNDSDAVARDAATYIAIPENTTYVDRSATGGLKPVSDEDGNVVALVADKLTLGAGATKTFRFAVETAETDGDYQVTAQATCGFGSASEAFSANTSNVVQHGVHVVKPELSITQSAEPADGAEVNVGDEITYVIKVRETAGKDASGVAVFDTIPAGTEFVSASDNLKTIAGEDGKVTAVYADGIDIAGRGMEAFMFTVRVTELDGDSIIKNDASCGFAEAPVAPLPVAANQVSHNGKAAKPAISVTQTADPANGSRVKSGDTITYTINIDETAGVAASGVALFDYVPAGTTLVESSLVDGMRAVRDESGRATAVVADGIDIDAKGSATRTFQVTVDDVTADATISNEATVGFASDPARPLNIASQQMLHEVVAVKPALSITTSATPVDGSVVKPGDTITYTIKVSETAGAPATGVAVFDELPAGVTVDATSLADDVRLITDAAGKPAIVIDGINIDANGEKTYTFAVTVDETDADAEISNRATAGFATAPTKALPVASKQVTHLVGALKPVLSVDMSATPESGSTVSGGDSITYTITVSEIAGAKADGVAIYSKVPAGVTIDETKLVDGLMLKDGALVADNLNLAANDSKTFTFTAAAKDVTEDAAISARATAGFATAPAKELPYASAQVNHLVAAPRPELSVELGAAPSGDVQPGDTITYTAKVTETAGAPANGAAIFVELPSGVTVNESELPSGATVVKNDDGSVKGVAITGIDIPAKGDASFDIPVTVDDTDKDASISARATAGFADEASGPLSNDSKEAMTNVVAGKPHLVITKVSNPAAGTPINVDDVIEYTFMVTNDGDGAATGVAVYDAIPENTTYVENSATAGLETISEDGRVTAVGATGITLGAGESKSFSFATTVNFGIDDDTIISNRATTGFSEVAKANLGTDSNEVATTVVIPDVRVTMTVDPKDGSTLYEGDDVNIDVNVRNYTTAHDKNVNIFVPVPDGLTYEDGSIIVPDGATVNTVTDADGNVTGIGIHFDEVAGNANENIRITFTVDGSRVTDISGNVTYGHGSDAPEGALEETVGSYAMTVDRVPHLSIVKRQEPGSGALVAGGDILTYSITVTNTGRSVAHKVGIYDEAPEHTKFVADSLTCDRGDVYVGDDGLLTAIAGDLHAGESATMTFKVKIDYGFTGAIYNRAMWVSPAADPGTAGNVDLDEAIENSTESNDVSGDVTAPGAVALARPLAAQVPIPDGAYSGVSNEVSAGDGTQTNPSDGGASETRVAVPDVVGETESDARSAIKGAGLKVSVTTENSDTVPEGKVISQDKTGNVAPGTTVAIVVSEGKAPAAPSTGTDTGTDTGSDTSSTTNPGGSNEVNADVKATEVKATLTASPKGGSEVNVGQVITYTLKLSNPSDVNANDLYVPVEMKGGLKVVASSINAKGISADVVDGQVVAHGTLKPGTGAIVTFKATVADNATDSVSAKATIGQSEYPAKPKATIAESERVVHEIAINFIDGSSNETSAHVGSTQVQVIKTSDPADGSIVVPGSKISYTVKVANVGNVNANDLYISDVLAEGLTLDASTLACDKLEVSASGSQISAVGTLAPSEVATITYTAKVADDFVGDIVNFAEWGQAEPGTVPDEMSGKSNEVLAHVGTTDVSLIKSANVADGEYVGYGDIIDYTIVAKNEGTLKEGADVVVTDTLPSGLEAISDTVAGGHVEGNVVKFDSVHLGKGDSHTFTFSAKVTAKDGDVSNVAVASVSTQDEDVTSNSHMAHVSVPELSVTKLSDPATGSFVSAGQAIGYSIVISNVSKVPGVVNFEDVLPDGVSYVNDSVGAKLYKIPADVKNADELVAAAALVDTTDVSASDAPNGFFPWLYDAFLSLFGAGTSSDAIKYDAGRVTGTIEIPAGYCLLVSYGTNVVDSVAAGTVIKNSVTISADGVEPEHSETSVIVGEADVNMSKSAIVTDAEGNELNVDEAGANVEAGSIITYSMHVSNAGVAPATDVVMGDTIPVGTTYVDGSGVYVTEAGAENVAPEDGKFSIPVGTLGDGESSGVLSFSVVVNDDAPEVVTNTGHYSVDDVDGDSNPVKTPISKATFEVKKVGIDSKGNEVKSFTAGSEVRWLISVKNTSSETADVVIMDKPGSSVSFVGSNFVTDSANKSVNVLSTGKSASEGKAETLLADAQRTALVSASSKTYKVGAGANNGTYYNGVALVNKLDSSDANVSAMPVPAGTYDVTCDAGYTASVTIYKAASDGSVDTGNVTSTINVESGKTESIEVPNGCMMVIKVKDINGGEIPPTARVISFVQTKSGDNNISNRSNQNVADYAAYFTADGMAPGETRTFVVRTKAAQNAGNTISNTVTVYNGLTGKLAGSATATLSKGAADGAKKGSENLPKTAASLMALGAIASGAAFVALGGVELVRSRRKKKAV